MRHGRRTVLVPRPKPYSIEICNILLVASLAKTLSESGTRNIDPCAIPISEPLVLQILRRNTLEPSRRLDFFKWCSSLGPKYKHTSKTYSLILRTVCSAGFHGEVPGLLGSMKQDGVVMDPETFKFVLDNFIRSGEFDSALEILGYVEELGTNLDATVYDSVLVALVSRNQVDLALSIFFRLLESSENNGCNPRKDVGNSLPGSNACNALLVALRKADMRGEFKTVFDKMREVRFELDPWGYNICIHAFGCWGDLRTSLGLFKEMKDKSSVSSSFTGPDLCTYNSLIHVLCLAGKVKDAIIVWEELKVSGHEPDAFTYRTIIQGCCKAYRMVDATKIFSEMQYNGFQPDTIVYNSLLNGMFKSRKVIEACQLFEKMVQDGARASCWTHNILIDGLFRNGRAEAGYTLFRDLKKKGQFVDAITYSIVVLQLCREGQLDEALRLVEEMEGRGFSVDLVTISSLLIGLHKQGRWNSTERLIRHIRESNLLPNVLRWKANVEASLKDPQSREKDYTSIFPSKGDLAETMNMIGKEDAKATDEKTQPIESDPWSSSPYMDQLAGEVNQAAPLFSLNRGKRVQTKGIYSFDINLVNTFLSIFLAKGNLSLACKLFEIFNDMGVGAVSYTYNSFMSSFVKRGYFREARGVLDQMADSFCPADIATYNVIIQGLGKMGRADLASAILDRLTKHGGYLDIVMYNTLINALGKAGRVDESIKLFEQMRSSGINPDVVTYNTMIEIHSKMGRLKEAYKYLKMMMDSGCLPNHVTDTILDYLGKEMDKSRFRKASFVRTDNNQ